MINIVLFIEHDESCSNYIIKKYTHPRNNVKTPNRRNSIQCKLTKYILITKLIIIFLSVLSENTTLKHDIAYFLQGTITEPEHYIYIMTLYLV